MRIVISTENNAGMGSTVSNHLGRSPFFALIDLEGDEVQKVQLIPNPHLEHHRPGEPAEFVASLGAEVIISGGMGQRAHVIFEAQGIKRATRASGTVQEAIASYLAGKLSSDESCDQHEHHHHHNHDHHHDDCQHHE